MAEKNEEKLLTYFIIFFIAIACMMFLVWFRVDTRLDVLESLDIGIPKTPNLFNEEYDYYWNCIAWSDEECNELEITEDNIWMPKGMIYSGCDIYCVSWTLRQQKKGLFTIEPTKTGLDDDTEGLYRDIIEFEESDAEICNGVTIFFEDYFKVYEENRTKQEIIDYIVSRENHVFKELVCYAD